MSVPVGVARTRSIGSGSTGPFAFNFVLYDQTHLTVVKTGLDGIDTTLMLTTDYTVTLNSDFSSASITLVNPLLGTGLDNGTSEILTITRDPPIQQLTEWPRNDPFPSRTHERAADLAVMMIGRLNEKVGRSLLLPESSNLSGLTIPNPVALNFLRWNAAGTALENALVATPGALIVSPFIMTLLDDVTAAAARATLGAGTGDVAGPASSVANRIATFSGTSGKALQDGGATIANIDPRGKHTVFIPAASVITSISAPQQGTVAPGGALGVVYRTLDFDPTTEEYGYFQLAMPKGWNVGSLSFQVVWSHAATVTNFGVAWDLYATATSDGDSIAVGAGAAPRVTDTGGTTNTLYITPESAALNVSGSAAAQDVLNFRINRAPGDAADTMAVDARLHGVIVYYTTNAPTDA